MPSAGSGSSRTPLIHPAPFRARQILLVVIGRRSASAPASPSRGPETEYLRAETGGRIQVPNAGERSEFGSQTATRLTNRPKLRGFLQTRACSPIGSKPRHSGISTGRFCDVCTSTGRKPWTKSRDARPFATRGPTTREGVGLKSGALLVREWNGRLERIMILDDGCAWNGCVYRSLSQVAKAITGTNWNGHRFFGLKAVRTGASNRKRNVTPRPNSLLDIGVSPTLAGFAAAMPDRSPPLATKKSEFGISKRIG